MVELAAIAHRPAHPTNSPTNPPQNALDMIGSLQLQYNRGRQAVITNELIDIITVSYIASLAGRVVGKGANANGEQGASAL